MEKNGKKKRFRQKLFYACCHHSENGIDSTVTKTILSHLNGVLRVHQSVRLLTPIEYVWGLDEK